MGIIKQPRELRPIFITLAVLFIIGLLGGYFIIRSQQQAMTKQFYDSGITLANSISRSLEHYMTMEDPELIQGTLSELTGIGQVKEATIISSNMRVYASSDNSKVGTFLIDPRVASVISGGGTLIRANEEDGSDTISVLVAMENKLVCQECHDPNINTGALGVIEIRMNEETLNAHLYEQALALALIGGLTLLVVGISIYLILRNTLVRPFSKRINDLINERSNIEKLYTTDRLASIGELASGIAHELNNPLTSVIGFSDLMLEKDLPNEIREDLQIVNSEAQRASQTVRNLLAFARKHPLEKKPVNINSIIEKVLEMRTYEQKVNNIRVDTNLAFSLPEVMGDPFQLQQVFLNIVINAEYFMVEAHQRGTLAVNTEEGDGTIRISFTDDGPGISEENMRHLFDPFFTTKEVGKGTGLGLSIVHGIVTEHGGTITVESELGKGATFLIKLPTTESQLLG